MRSLLLAALTLAGALPEAGTLVPGESLGGLRLGATPARVSAAWGPTHGVCRSCRQTTWYFTYRPFEPQSVGVELRRGRVSALFTLWQPAGWRTPGGLRLGDDVSRVTALYGPLPRVRCAGYDALTLRRGRTLTAFYVLRDELWGFGLARAGARPCRE
ncbi:MAG: hypothetical protein WD067_03495 [Gaiellaceae bacterium]